MIFLKIPSISKFQWHPFSITSSSSVDEHTISVIVKSEGQWTSSLHNKVIHDEPDSEADQSKCIPVAIEGPYGPASMDFLRYKFDELNVIRLLISKFMFIFSIYSLSHNLSVIMTYSW